MSKLTTLLHTLHRPKFHIAPEHPTSMAFECGGVQYYQFDDPFNIPYRRGFSALVFYNELRMGCTRDDLKKYVETIEGIISDPVKISIAKIARLTDDLKMKLNFIYEPDILYKLASVVFFDQSENPATYDFKYGQKKIELWKKHKSVEDFFLLQPIQRLVPYLKDCEVDIEAYTKAVSQVTAMQREVLSTISSNKESTNANAKPWPLPDGSPKL